MYTFVMLSVITGQLDYIYFFYGFSFIILALLSYSLWVRKDKDIPWGVLCLFGLVHGLAEWLDLSALYVPNSPAFTFIRITVMAISFVSLFEFGRRLFNKSFSVNISFLIYILLIPLSLYGYRYGLDGLNGTIRNTFCLSGAFLAALGFITAETRKAEKPSLVATGISLFLYGLASGLIIPLSKLTQAQFLNYEFVSSYFGIPIQLVRGLLIVGFSISVWVYYQKSIKTRVTEYSKILIFSIIGLVFLGGILSNQNTLYYQEQSMATLLNITKTAAAAINPERISVLTVTSADLANIDFIRLREQIGEINKSVPSIRWFYLLSQKDNKVVFMVDALPFDSPFYSPIGQVYDEAPSAIYTAFKGTPSTTVSYTDRWGSFASAFVPVKDFNTGEVVAVLGSDMDVSYLRNAVLRQNLSTILVVFFLELVLLTALINHQKFLVKEEELDAGEKDLKKFKLAVEFASDHIVITDKQGTILYANKAVETITGFHLTEVLGTKAGTLWGKLMPDSFYKTFWHTIKNKKQTFQGEITNHRKNGERYTASVSISPVLDEDNKVEYFVGIERDVTKAKEVDRMKTEFISLASHQLRTPLTAIKWYIEMVLNGESGKLNKEQKEFLSIINTSNNRMIDLVNSLLNVSRIESGRIIIDPEPTNINALLNGVLMELEVYFKEKKIVPVVNVSFDIPEINLDPKLIRQVLMNLLTNAIKYTPESGSITAGITVDKEKVIVQVTDTGYGIPYKDMDRVFTKFYRGENILKTMTDGNGLGLYLVKAIIDSSGGTVWFESVEGKGTTFWFSLPIAGIPKKEGAVSLAV